MRRVRGEHDAPGLQEENKVLRKAIVGLETQVKDLRAERVSGESDMKKEFEDRQAKEQQLHQERVAQLGGTVAGLRLELGAVARENIVLQEYVDRRPRLKEAHEVRSGVSETVLTIFLALSLIVLVMVATRNRALRGRLDLCVVQNASSYRILERWGCE